MKTLTLVCIAGVILLIGCASPLPATTFFPRESNYYGISFTKYNEQGFLITPEKYIGDYESIGIVRYKLMPESRLVTITEKIYSDGSKKTYQQWVSEQISVTQCVDSLYAMARKMGADAIVNFDANNIDLKPLPISGIELTGFAIKRKTKSP